MSVPITRKRRNSSFSTDITTKKLSDDGHSSQEEDVGGESKATLRFSARVIEKQEKLIQAKQTPPKKDPESVLEKEERKKRNWTLWSGDDKQLFFEALNEYGKDFDSIQNYISSKNKAKVLPKNKDQVRHFYYRTWNKISKFLSFPDMKKAHQELYGLVNYGELRKKQRVLNFKTAVKLSELVEKGSTTIKVRGKTFRIKTPVCRALKKLNKVEEQEAKLPTKISLELLPKNGVAWAYVQNLSHNPRVLVSVSLQRSLSSVIKFFEDRWKAPEDKLKEELLQTLGKQLPRLRFTPQSLNTHPPLFKVTEAASSARISLKAYKDNQLPTPTTGKPDKRLDSGEDTEDEKVDHNHSGTNGPDTNPECNCNGEELKLKVTDYSKGWTCEEAGTLTIGELYLILGHCSVLKFEYSWDKYETKDLIQKLIMATNLLKKKKMKTKQSTCPNCGHNSSKANPNESSRETSVKCHLSSTEQCRVPLVSIPSIQHPNTSTTTIQSIPVLEIPEFRQPITQEPLKPLVLPKGNRRLGRPVNKRIVPRILPLGPKTEVQSIPSPHPSHPPVVLPVTPLIGSTISSSEFNDLIKIKPVNDASSSNFSLGSFMDISLPESSGASNLCGKFLCDDSSLLNLLECKESSSMSRKPVELSNGPWSNDLSLSSLLSNLEAVKSNEVEPNSTNQQSDPVTFQSVVGESHFLQRFDV